LLTFNLMCPPGELATLYAVMACVTMSAALFRSRPRQVWAVASTVLVLVVLIWDDQAGKALKRYRRSFIASESVPPTLKEATPDAER
jgi:hypothetical protein